MPRAAQKPAAEDALKGSEGEPDNHAEHAAPTSKKPSGPIEPLFSEELTIPAIEAVVMTSDRPISAGKIALALGLNGRGDGVKIVRDAVDALNAQYDESHRSFRIENVAGGYRVVTRPDFAPAVRALHGVRESGKLSRAGVETLAIIAYKQPITRADIESIRGVACGEVLRTLLDRRLVDIVGRAEELGRPMLYGTSKLFLETFGLANLKDLPNVGEIFPEVAGAIEKQEKQDKARRSRNPAAGGATESSEEGAPGTAAIAEAKPAKDDAQ